MQGRDGLLGRERCVSITGRISCLDVSDGLLKDFVRWESKGEVSPERNGTPLAMIGLPGESLG